MNISISIFLLILLWMDQILGLNAASNRAATHDAERDDPDLLTFARWLQDHGIQHSKAVLLPNL